MIAITEEKGESTTTTTMMTRMTTTAMTMMPAPSAHQLSTTSGNLAIGAARTDLHYGALRTDQHTDSRMDVPSVRTLLKRTRTSDVRKKTDNGGCEVVERTN